MFPTLAGFIAWVRSAMGIPEAALPDDSDFFVYAFNVALEIVNPALNCASPTIYTLAVYNLAGDNLINWAQDVPGQTYFSDARTTFKCFDFVAGVVLSAGDEGTSDSLVVPEAFKTFTMANLQNLKTPYGRQYLAFAQSYGPTIWGLS